MTPSSLDECKTVEKFVSFLSKLDASIGQLGGRYFVTCDGKTSYNMNQIVYQFQQIVQEERPQRLEILFAAASIRRLEESELFEALVQNDDSCINAVQREMTKIRQLIGNFIFKIFHNGFDRRAVLNSLTLGHVEQKLTSQEKIYTDPYKLIVRKDVIEPSHFSWLLNLGLLRMAEEEATEEEKEQIRFLAANFLTKSAPIQLQCWRPFFKKIDPKFEEMFETLFQVGPFDEYRYHRESVQADAEIGKDYNKKLRLSTDSPFFPIDSLECTHLYALKYTVLEEEPSIDTMVAVLEKHLGQGPENALKNPLPLPFLIDLTKQFGGDFRGYTEKMGSCIKQAVGKLVEKQPKLASYRTKLQEFIKENMISIARVEKGEVKGIKVLSLWKKVPSQQVEHLVEFIKLTGLYLGAISLRRQALDAFGRYPDVQFAIPASKKPVLYYSKKEDFINTNFFTRLSTFFEQKDQNPSMSVLGGATMRLLQGLMEEISSKKWDEINKSPALGQIFQASLMMIREHLATAEMYVVKNDFSRFAQEIELVHAEMATLLELIRPFDRDDFEQIYKKSVEPILPSALHSCYRGGELGKTAMNIFAGINVAVMQLHKEPQRVYGKNIYFEEQMLVGDNHKLEEIKENPLAPPVDLYVAQFNPNVNVDYEVKEYRRENVGENIRYLLTSGKASKQLTVAVDCTIEKTPSPNIKELLEEFKEEVKEGKINFVFFNSGQKFDMLGMDNYYGAPFFMVNNGDEKWKPFDSLLHHPIHRTDSLSTQWFCLSHKYASKSLAQYKDLVFKNTRYILDRIPTSLLPRDDPKQQLKVNQAHPDMDVCFIDIKLRGLFKGLKSFQFMELFYKKMVQAGVKVYSRQSFGFYHPCYLVFNLPGDNPASTTRLTPGINPDDNEAIIDFFKQLAQSQE